MQPMLKGLKFQESFLTAMYISPFLPCLLFSYKAKPTRRELKARGLCRAIILYSPGTKMVLL